MTAVPTDARFTEAPELSAEEATIVARFEDATPAPGTWWPEHSATCTVKNRAEGWYPADCERCDRYATQALYRLGARR